MLLPPLSRLFGVAAALLAGRTPVMVAAEFGHVPAIHELALMWGVNLDTQDEMGPCV